MTKLSASAAFTAAMLVSPALAVELSIGSDHTIPLENAYCVHVPDYAFQIYTDILKEKTLLYSTTDLQYDPVRNVYTGDYTTMPAAKLNPSDAPGQIFTYDVAAKTCSVQIYDDIYIYAMK